LLFRRTALDAWLDRERYGRRVSIRTHR
jgi:hypothetical protein